MALDFSSESETTNCLESVQTKYDCKSSKTSKNPLNLRSRNKCRSASMVQSNSSLSCSTKPEHDVQEDSVLPLSEGESFVKFPQNDSSCPSPGGITRKFRPMRELTIKELLSEFWNSWKSQPTSISVGHFRDQAVMRFRRALYHSGIWVSHVQGYKSEKHFPAHYFKKNPGYLRRLIPWLKRELTSIYGDYGYTVKNILSTIIHHMTEYDLDSYFFINLLEPYLQQYTHQFLHEFISFVHSSYSMETYDQRAIYQCTPVLPWLKKKSNGSSLVMSVPNNQEVLASQHNTSQPKIEARSLMGLREFPNGNSSLKKSEILMVPQESESKDDAPIKEKPESGDHKDITLTDNVLLYWATMQKNDPLDYPKNAKEMKIEGKKWVSGQVQDIKRSEETALSFSNPAIINQERPGKYNLKEQKVLNIGQQADYQKKYAEKVNYSESHPKFFHRRLPRDRSLVSCKSRKRDPSCSCISENALSCQTDVRKQTSLRKKRMKCRQQSQFEEVASHASRRIQRQSRPSKHRSKSWCVSITERSVSKNSSYPSLRESPRFTHLTQNIYLAHLYGKNVHGNESVCRRASSATVQHRRLPSASEKKPKCPKSKGSSQARNQSISPISIQIKENSCPRKPEIKPKDPSVKDDKSKEKRYKNPKCQCANAQNTEESCNEIEDLNHIRQIGDLSECASFLRRKIQLKKENSKLQLHYPAWKGLEAQKNTKQQTYRGTNCFERQLIHSSSH